MKIDYRPDAKSAPPHLELLDADRQIGYEMFDLAKKVAGPMPGDSQTGHRLHANTPISLIVLGTSVIFLPVPTATSDRLGHFGFLLAGSVSALRDQADHC